MRSAAGSTLTLACALFLAAGCGKDRVPLLQGLLRDRMVARLDAARPRIEALRGSASARIRLGADSCLAEESYLRYRIKTQVDEGRRRWGGIRRGVEALERDIVVLEDGEDVIVRKRGRPFLQAYVSHIDGSPQPYSIVVPNHYTGEKPFPLVVRLHGHAGFRPFQGHPVEPVAGAICVAPHGRGASDYMGIGEDDVLQVIRHVQRSHWIDPDRIYLEGSSMGGTGCWALACRHPHLFAGIVPLAGNADHRVWEREWLWKREGEFRMLRNFLRAADSPVTFARNLVNVPVVCIHGGGDTVVPPGHARSMVGALRAAGGNVRYLEFLDAGHGRFPANARALALAQAASHVRARVPRKVHVTTESLRHGRAHWLEITGIERPCEPASADAELEHGPAGIKLTTTNVMSAAFHLDGSAFGLAEDIEVTWNGRRAYSVQLPLPGEGPLVVHDPLAAKVRAAGLRKRRGLEGPVSDVFLDAFVIVRGTGECPEAQREMEAMEIGRFRAEWKRRYGALPRVKADTEIDQADIRDRNLVIFGGPAGNSVYRSIEARLPIRVDRDGAAVTCAGRTYRGPDVGAIFCYPNPANPRRLVAVFTGASRQALYQVSSRFGKWFDWGVFDTREWFDYAVFDARTSGPESYLAVGFFGWDWSFGRGRKWEGLASVRSGTPAMLFPGPIPDGGRIALSTMMPSAIDQMRGAVGFGRSFMGNHITLGNTTYTSGLGVRAPSTITYGLSGEFRRLTAVVGLDLDGEDKISLSRLAGEKAKFIVAGDGKVLFETEKPVSWRNNAVAIEVDVRGVSELELSVKPAGGPVWLQGSSAWADAWLER